MINTQNIPMRKLFLIKIGYITLLLLIFSMLGQTSITHNPVSTANASTGIQSSSLQLSSGTQLEILFYEIYFDIDPINGRFYSSQNISLVAHSSVKSISFHLHSDLVINEIRMWDNASNDISIESWQTNQDQISEWTVGMKFLFTQVNLDDYLAVSAKYYLHVEYAIKPEVISSEVGDEIFRFVVSTQGTRGLAWPSGLVPKLTNANKYHAPHSISIKHPNDQSCMVTGNRVSTIKEGDYTTESYLSQRMQSTAPSFACDDYEILSLTRNNITVELFYFEGEAATQEVLEIILEGIILFTDHLGDTGDRHYQFGYVDVEKSQIGGTSRRDTIFMRSGDSRNFETNLKDKVLFVTVLLHEIAHNWNGFIQGDTWSGNDYFLWYQEGSSNFLASWACEKIMGQEASKIYRKYNLERYEQFKGYNSQYNLKTIPNEYMTNLSDIMIAYEYAGMVWEQVLLKLGNETVFNGLSDFVHNFWINESWTGAVSINDLFNSFEKYTEIDVEEYLEQWGITNPKIELYIIDTHTEKVGERFETTVEINVVADRDYEIFTSIGYDINSKQELVNVNFTKSGKQIVSFTTDAKPNSIQIDPEYRVPRVGVLIIDDEDQIVFYLVGITILLILAVIGLRFIKKWRFEIT
ncbi:MAG: M1 family aminopeptidase [Candidatus Kariarchaeaceae archaeon]